MVRYKVILAYDGTDFQGFQRQAKARTVQSVVEAALRSFGWEGKAVLAAGRTDTGVHASGQVIAFDLDWAHSTQGLQRAINAHLPSDVVVRSVRQVSVDFHPRYAAQARRYQYRIFCDEVRQPLQERYAWRVWPEVSTALLQQLSNRLIGTHDFGAFGSPPRAGGSTVRNITSAIWLVDGPEMIFEIIGNAFLYRMVRRLVSFQVEVAQDKMAQGELDRFLVDWVTIPVRGTAPAHGLTLVEVIYPPENT
ncbi:MAG TPA: tRNA pseudouridine(38-40) synthase TruA [Anaerolineales bacterium]|nr:tRNA pseudouridine(38-40) synthase TruA [Anaerolineales bacterium]